jgi:DNA-binding response OmpR family regulator
MNLLIVDDDVHIRALIKTCAETEDFSCIEAEDRNTAFDVVERYDFDVIVLDVMMLGKTDLETLVAIRATCETPVIMLTARTEEYDRLYGFDLEADDCVPKPFSPKELIARIKAILKRVSGIGNGANVLMLFSEGTDTNTRCLFVNTLARYPFSGYFYFNNTLT